MNTYSSQLGVFSSRGHLATSGDIFGCHSLEGGLFLDPVGRSQGCCWRSYKCTGHPHFPTKNYPTQIIKSDKVENPDVWKALSTMPSILKELEKNILLPLLQLSFSSSQSHCHLHLCKSEKTGATGISRIWKNDWHCLLIRRKLHIFSSPKYWLICPLYFHIQTLPSLRPTPL